MNHPVAITFPKDFNPNKIFIELQPQLSLKSLFEQLKQTVKIEGDMSEYLMVTYKEFEIDDRTTVQMILQAQREIIGILKKTDFEEIRKIKPFYQAISLAASVLTEEQRHMLALFNKYRNIIKSYNEECLGKLMDALPIELIQSDIPDENLAVITKWFKEEFFTFVPFKDTTCPICGNKTNPIGMGPPTRYESEGGARVVELSRCTVCDAVSRFPRYESAPRLLETRKGRCMEFVIVFAGMLMSFGFDVRSVVDTTDHVWVEVWLDSKQRYVHVDPCENIIDAPYTYEEGWGKKLEWVIAFGANEVYDVTPRYTKNLNACIERRSAKVPEEFYHKIIDFRNQQYQSHLSEEEKEEIKKKNELDIESMKEIRTEIKAEEQRPRISGSN